MKAKKKYYAIFTAQKQRGGGGELELELELGLEGDFHSREGGIEVSDPTVSPTVSST